MNPKETGLVKATHLSVDNNKIPMELTLDELLQNVKSNLIICDNFEFTIRIDLLMNDSIRYMCWKKPKPFRKLPDLILTEGQQTKNTASDRQEYQFSNEDWTYEIEKIIPKDVDLAPLIFLEIRNKANRENYAWKMRDLSSLQLMNSH